uniref:Sulfotransferase n=1 Tax=Ciona savignyi TaxID=51511 RepID=H2Z1K8_CIOSA
MLGKVMCDVVLKVMELIPEAERPDVQSWLQSFTTAATDSIIPNWREYKMLPAMVWFGNPGLVDFAYNDWQPRSDDIIISTFPKTGTTWMRDVCRHLIYEHDSIEFQFTKLFLGPHVYLETGTEEKYELLDKLPWKRRILGTHLSAGMMNLERIRKSGAKIIYVIRNPKDQMVSMFNMMKSLSNPDNQTMQMFPSDFNDFALAALEGKVLVNLKPGQNYFDHILSWYPHRHDENVMFLYYEDMKKNPAEEIAKLAKFLDVYISEEGAKNIADLTSFEKTKQRMKDGVPFQFYNKGSVGNWKNHFNVALSERVDLEVKEKLAETDIKFTYV